MSGIHFLMVIDGRSAATVAIHSTQEPSLDQRPSTPHAPRAVGPYAQGRVLGEVLYASGQLPIVPATGTLIAGTPAELTRRCLDNL
jgi:enamine deaminase RidA (YjgF/YER057c/UK114 family)